MALYRKGSDGLELLTDQEEATVRAELVADGSSGPVLTMDNGLEIAMSDSESNAVRAEWAIESALMDPIFTKEASKITGIEILGVMCSATKADQMGLTAVGLDYSMTTAGGGTFGSTKFEFANGNTLVITADNFATIYNLWVPFRRSFFAP